MENSVKESLKKLESIIKYILLYHIEHKNNEKIREWEFYKNNFKQLTVDGLSLLLEKANEEIDEMTRNVPEKVTFT